MEAAKKGWIGVVITVASLVLLVLAFITASYFSKCEVPMGSWNIFFTLVLLSIGGVYLINDFVRPSEALMGTLVRCSMVFMIVVFLWGDFFLLLTLVDTPKCMAFPLMILYIFVMFVGSIVSAIEGFSILKSVVE